MSAIGDDPIVHVTLHLPTLPRIRDYHSACPLRGFSPDPKKSTKVQYLSTGSKSQTGVLHCRSSLGCSSRPGFCFSKQGMSWDNLHAGSIAAIQLVKASSTPEGGPTHDWLFNAA